MYPTPDVSPDARNLPDQTLGDGLVDETSNSVHVSHGPTLLGFPTLNTLIVYVFKTEFLSE